MSTPGFIRIQGDGILLSIKLQPRASKNEVLAAQGDELRIRVTAPPVDSAANEALVKFLADQLDIPRRQVQLVRGQTSRHKAVKLSGISAAAVWERLSSPSR